MNRWFASCGPGVLVVCLAGATQAGQPDVKQMLELMQKQSQQIEALQKRVQQLEAQQTQTRQAIVDEVKRTDALASQVQKVDVPAVAKLASWAEKIRFSGDFRYRHEFFDDGVRTSDRDRHRQRIRARLGMHATPSDDLDFYLRIATGSDPDPVSTNNTLTDGFSKKHLWLDRAYVDWHPELLSGARVLAGKMANPFVPSAKTDLVWDLDVNPEGLALNHTLELSETLSVFATAGHFWLAEHSGGADTTLVAGQAGVKASLSETVTLTAGASLYDFNHVRDQTVLIDPEDPMGNTATMNGDGEFEYAEDFRLWEAFAELAFQAGGLPVSLHGQYVNNVAADSGEDTGWLAGVRVGKAKNPGEWELFYNYRRLEADAVIGALTDSDMFGGGSDGRGHKIGGAVQLTKSTQLAAKLMLSDVGLDEEDDYKRLQVDFKVKF